MSPLGRWKCSLDRVLYPDVQEAGSYLSLGMIYEAENERVLCTRDSQEMKSSLLFAELPNTPTNIISNDQRN